MTTMTPTAYNTPSMFFTEEQVRLLANAETIINENYCLNYCRHHRPFATCTSCSRFEAARDGHIACDGYKQFGEDLA